MKTSVVLLSIAAVCIGLGANEKPPAPKASVYQDGLYGFSLRAPRFPEVPKGLAVVAVMMLGPAEGGFASNVNVTVQRVTTTLDQYLELSLNQFKAAGWTVNSTRKLKVSGKDAVQIDYEGRIQGRDLRFLALAVVHAERVYVTTCTATKDGFEKTSKEFEACLASFKVDAE